MSGAEAVAILGIISSVISIVDGTKQGYDAASNTNGLPEAFREVAARLPIVRDILDLAKQHISEGDINEKSCKAAKNVVENCQSKAQNLEGIFKKVIPADDASRSEKYFLAVKSLGKGNRVETLMKGMLEDLQLLAIEHDMITGSGTRGKVARAIEEVAALHPSLTEHATDETGFTAIHSSSGAINQVQRDQFNNPGSGSIYHAQSMNFGPNGKN